MNTDSNRSTGAFSSGFQSLVVVIILSVLVSVPGTAEAGLFSKKGSKAKTTKSVTKSRPSTTVFPKKRSTAAVAVPSVIRPPSRTPSKPTVSRVSPPRPESPRPRPEREDSLSPVDRTHPDQLRIFVLSDSQGLLPFGPELQKKLVDAGHEVLFHSVKNGTPYFWQGQWPSPVLTRIYEPAAVPEACGVWREVSMRPRSIEDYVLTYDPDVFVFQAGTNFEQVLAGRYTESIVGMIQESVAVAGSRGARVLWIGPPDARDDVRSEAYQDRAVATLKSALSGVSDLQGHDCFFDSRPHAPIPAGTRGDGEHPTNSVGVAWADAAAAWTVDSVSRLSCDGLLRARGGVETPVTRLFSKTSKEASGTPPRSFRMELELVAKSDPGDIRTLDYTDAFSVFQYRLKSSDAPAGELSGLGVVPPQAQDDGQSLIYVLHWAVHNDGRGPRHTRVSARKIGDTFTMQLAPLSEHPLSGPLATMRQFNDFNDFLAPVFVATDFLGERTF